MFLKRCLPQPNFKLQSIYFLPSCLIFIVLNTWICLFLLWIFPSDKYISIIPLSFLLIDVDLLGLLFHFKIKRLIVSSRLGASLLISSNILTGITLPPCCVLSLWRRLLPSLRVPSLRVPSLRVPSLLRVFFKCFECLFNFLDFIIY